ncbi:MAG: terminase large subunit, partial [Prevotellaceae bacterium]|nr:terminase large subunit [Prevotellaceae bacterium]
FLHFPHQLIPFRPVDRNGFSSRSRRSNTVPGKLHNIGWLQLDSEYKYHKVHRGRDIEYKPTKSILHTIATHSKGLDGFNPYYSCIDEFHAATSSDVYNVLSSGMGMRENPHLMIITTAGFDLSVPSYQMHNDCVDVLNGLAEDNNTFSMIFELDPEDDYTNPEVWIKSNPNLGITVRKEWLQDQIKNAQNSRNDQTNVLTKNLDMWVNAPDSWIDDKYIIQSMKEFPQFDAGEIVSYVGVDLSSVSDLTAVNFMIKYNDIFYMDTHYYLPEQFKMQGEYNKQKFVEWYREGYLCLTPGNVTDYNYILNDILNYPYQIKAVYYDTYNATQFAISGTQEGIEFVPYSQSVGSFNKPTKELERLILQGSVVMMNNPVTLFCYRNVQLKYDMFGNCKPDKANRDRKVDGVIAQIQSLAGYLLEPVAPSIC